MPCLLKCLEDLAEMIEETFHVEERMRVTGKTETRKGKEITRHVKGIANVSIL